MFRHTIPLGRIFGITVDLDYSWFLVFGLLTWMLAVSYFPSEFKNWNTAEYWFVGSLTAVLFFASVLTHELGHSLVAMRYKVQVPRITLFIFRSEEHTSELQSQSNLVCRLLLEKKKYVNDDYFTTSMSSSFSFWSLSCHFKVLLAPACLNKPYRLSTCCSVAIGSFCLYHMRICF